MRIAEIFHSVQGEGKLAGVPSAFVRVSGCNLRCTWCDTPYASWNPEGAEMGAGEIAKKVLQFGSRHVVITGGEPAIMADVVELCELLKQQDRHITLETAATVFTPAKIDLASLSPKLANSTPTEREGGRFAAAHEKQRLNVEVIQRFIDQSTDFQLKFVVSGEEDLNEIKEILKQLSGWEAEDVLLMPEGFDRETLESRLGWIGDVCKREGFRVCQRLHVLMFGNRRGT